VRHESKGYPRDTELPDYRFVSVSYTASFSGPFGSGIKNAPISSYLVKKFAGEHWVRHEMRESVAAADDLLTTAEDGGHLGINASDLILLHWFVENLKEAASGTWKMDVEVATDVVKEALLKYYGLKQSGLVRRMMPNPSIEQTFNRLRRSAAAHVTR
jgi:hypothetical protein